MIAIVSCGHKSDDERIYFKQIKSLVKFGYSVKYFTRSESKVNLSTHNLNHINLQKCNYSVFEFINFVIKQIDDVKVLHIHEYELLPLAKKFKKKYNKKIIYDVHDSLYHMWDTFSSYRGILKKVINGSLSIYEKYYLKYVDEIILANKPFDNISYDSVRYKKTIIENFPLIKNLGNPKSLSKNPIILYQGQISDDRGLSFLVRAMKLVVLRYPNVRLEIVGPSRPLDYKSILQKQIDNQKLDHFINIYDDIPHLDIWQYLKRASIGVIPSIKSPRVSVDTPTKLFEYMASGCVVIGTDLPPVRHFLNGAGVLVKHSSSDDLANAIIKVLSDKKLFESLSMQAIEHIKNYYNWSFPEQKLLALYKRSEL